MDVLDWLLVVVVAAGGVALAVVFPGTLAFWMSPLLALPLLLAIGFEYLSPWGDISASRRHAAWMTSIVAAAGASLLLLLAPGATSYLLAGLLVLPLFVVLERREDDDPDKRVSSRGDPARDLPDFPGDF